MAALELRVDKDNMQITDVKSVYTGDHTVKYRSLIKNKRLRYADKARALNWARTEGSTIFLLLTTAFANQGPEIMLKENQPNVNTKFSSIAEEITVAETSVEEVENNKGVSEKLEATRVPNAGRQDSSTPKGRLHRFTEHVNHIDEISAKIAENNEHTETHVSFSMRTKAEPKVKGIGYKVFYRGKDGKLYPPMVANPGGADTPVGVWMACPSQLR